MKLHKVVYTDINADMDINIEVAKVACNKCNSKAISLNYIIACSNPECENYPLYDHCMYVFKQIAAAPGYEESLKDFPIASCDGCDAEIKRAPGCRHKCTTCEDFDFCGGCIASVPHHEGHEFVDYHAPLTQ